MHAPKKVKNEEYSFDVPPPCLSSPVVDPGSAILHACLQRVVAVIGRRYAALPAIFNAGSAARR